MILVGGSLYLVQLAKDYSQNSFIIPFMFSIALFLEYALLAFILIRNARSLQRTLHELIAPD